MLFKGGEDMTAFDRIKSGIPEMDIALDNIRLGDNVVWRVSELSQFKLFMEPYIRQAIEDKKERTCDAEKVSHHEVGGPGRLKLRQTIEHIEGIVSFFLDDVMDIDRKGFESVG